MLEAPSGSKQYKIMNICSREKSFDLLIHVTMKLTQTRHASWLLLLFQCFQCYYATFLFAGNIIELCMLVLACSEGSNE